MLKEQILNLATNALARAIDAQEKFKSKFSRSFVLGHIKKIKEVAFNAAIARKGQEDKIEDFQVSSKLPPRQTPIIRRERKSSIKPAREIISHRADSILVKLKNEPIGLKTEALNNKQSLICLIWALGQAERASIDNGISIHDVSALLYKAHKINLYPINISRVVHCNELLVRQAGQEKRTKTYLLTEAGMKLFCDKFVGA